MGIEPTSAAWEASCDTGRTEDVRVLAGRPVLFTRQRLPRRFALRLCQKHSAQIVATIYCVEAVFRFRQLIVDYLEERMCRSPQLRPSTSGRAGE